MLQYVIVYQGGSQPSSPERCKQHFAKYMDSLSSLGDAAVSALNPLRSANTVSPDGTESSGSATTISGYTIIEASSMEAALAVARACSFLDTGGALEVSELAEMPGLKYRLQ